MKKKISKDEFSQLDDILKAQYKESGGQYLLDLEDGDVDALKRAKDHEKGLRKDAEQKLRDAVEKSNTMQSELDALKSKSVDESGNVDEIKAHYQQKLDDALKVKDDQLKAIQTQLESTLIDSTTNQVISGLNAVDTCKPVLSQLIRQRLAIETKEGALSVGILDGEGKQSLADIKQLQSELLETADLAPMFIGTKGSGGGAGPLNKHSGSTAKKISEMTATEEAAFERDQPEQYATALANEFGE
ncbi:MAG: hypothetical protein NE330_23850 [Lentisphaeraceae bacterium]|nr:hypothetical protein [Lentisphaeraceae bacterium]